MFPKAVTICHSSLRATYNGPKYIFVKYQWYLFFVGKYLQISFIGVNEKLFKRDLCAHHVLRWIWHPVSNRGHPLAWARPHPVPLVFSTSHAMDHHHLSFFNTALTLSLPLSYPSPVSFPTRILLVLKIYIFLDPLWFFWLPQFQLWNLLNHLCFSQFCFAQRTLNELLMVQSESQRTDKLVPALQYLLKIYMLCLFHRCLRIYTIYIGQKNL